jgi:hypothetical protein
MTESRTPMGEIRPVITLAETRQLQRGLTEKVLEKAASDPQWKQQLLDDPEAAMRAANFPEAQKVKQRWQEMQEGTRPWREEAEVMGQGGSIKPRECWTPVTYSCEWFTWYWEANYGERLCSISQG